MEILAHEVPIENIQCGNPDCRVEEKEFLLVLTPFERWICNNYVARLSRGLPTLMVVMTFWGVGYDVTNVVLVVVIGCKG